MREFYRIGFIIASICLVCLGLFNLIASDTPQKPSAPPVPSVLVDHRVIDSMEGPSSYVFSLVDGSKWVVIGPQHQAVVLWEEHGSTTWHVLGLSYNDGPKPIDMPAMPPAIKQELDQLNSSK